MFLTIISACSMRQTRQKLFKKLPESKIKSIKKSNFWFFGGRGMNAWTIFFKNVFSFQKIYTATFLQTTIVNHKTRFIEVCNIF